LSNPGLDERYKNIFTFAKRELQEEHYSPNSKNSLKRIIKIGGMVAALGGLIFVSVGCPNTTNNDAEKVKIQALTNVIDTDSYVAVPGAEITYIYGSKNINATPGQQVDITEVTKGTTANVKIVVKKDGYLEKWIKQEPMTGTHSYTINIKNLDNIDLNTFLNEIVKDGYIPRFKPNSNGVVPIYFNPDFYGTEKTLPLDVKNEIKNGVWKWIKDNSNSNITQVNFDDGNYKAGDWPGDGGMFYFEDTKFPGVLHTNDEYSDGSVSKIKVRINSDSLGFGYEPIWTESLDSLFDGEINLSSRVWKPLVIFAFQRIAGRNNGYQISSSHEEQNETDNYSGTAKYLGQLVITTTTGVGPIGPSGRIEEFYPANKSSKRDKKNSETATRRGTVEIRR